MTAVTRKFRPLNGNPTPAARFYLETSGQVKLFFNCQAVEQFGVGVEFRSADLFHFRDPEAGTENIILELFEEPSQGQIMLSYIPRDKATKAAITKFVRQMEISFQTGVRCPLWVSGSLLYLDLNSA